MAPPLATPTPMTPTPAYPPGLEPLYTLKKAVDLIPFTSLHALMIWLDRRKRAFPPRYMRLGRRPQRMLTLTELQQIRSERVKSEYRNRKTPRLETTQPPDGQK